MPKKEELINLDECVLNALDLFVKTPLPSWNINYKRPLVVGSGNAFVTGKILFRDADAIFADESSYENALEKFSSIDGAVIISASGGKHAPIIAGKIRQKGINTTLLTNNPGAIALNEVDNKYIFPKNSEPYTYNTSTYLSMITSQTKENPLEILSEVKKLEKKIPKNLKKYDSYYFLVPEQFGLVRDMFLTKFDELFGSKITGRVFTFEQSRHARTVVPSDKELFVSFGVDNKIFGKSKFQIPIYPQINYGGLIALGYYFIGKIQKQNPPYFKKNIGDFVKFQSKTFGQKIEVIAK
jgi:hypothetical protein